VRTTPPAVTRTTAPLDDGRDLRVEGGELAAQAHERHERAGRGRRRRSAAPAGARAATANGGTRAAPCAPSLPRARGALARSARRPRSPRRTSAVRQRGTLFETCTSGRIRRSSCRPAGRVTRIRAAERASFASLARPQPLRSPARCTDQRPLDGRAHRRVAIDGPSTPGRASYRSFVVARDRVLDVAPPRRLCPLRCAASLRGRSRSASRSR
jgi:hypothetical protein